MTTGPMSRRDRQRSRKLERAGGAMGSAGKQTLDGGAQASIQRVGNQGVQRLLNESRGLHDGAPLATASGQRLQRKLSVGGVGDSMEHEADRVAERALASPPRGAGGGRGVAISPIPTASGNATQAAPQSVERALASPGNPLPAAPRHDMEQRFGADLGAVRVHTDAAAAQSTRDVDALAYTAGTHVVFGAGRFAPGTGEGARLLAHELTHVIQQSGGVPAGAHAEPERAPGHDAAIQPAHTSAARVGSVVQRAIKPEDVSSEMVGEDFELADAFTSGGVTLAKGTVVTAMAWVNADTTVSVLAWVSFGIVSVPKILSVPKTLLRPVRPSGTRLDPYSAGIAGQARAVEKNEADLVGKTGAEKTRLEGLLATRRAVLNRKLIQETMFNRFDPIIASEVAAANTAHGLTGAAALDPDLVKAMLFQESEMGTSGTHLEVPPTHPVKSRFNLGQVIDSSGLALLTMLEREQPLWVAVFFLTNLRSDLAKAQTDKATLEKKTKRSATEDARLIELKRLSSGSWETFIWEYKAAGMTIGFAEAINGFFASSSPAKNMDYTFWIHMAVLWLFEKKTPTRTWAETIKAYNGSGKRAEHYRDAVLKRAAGAETAAKAGTPFTPTR